jgi:hypothetical protein
VSLLRRQNVVSKAAELLYEHLMQQHAAPAHCRRRPFRASMICRSLLWPELLGVLLDLRHCRVRKSLRANWDRALIFRVPTRSFC